MYDQETNSSCEETRDRSEGKADSVRHIDGKHYLVSLCFGYGNRLYAWPLGQRSGQRRDIQDDFTRFFYSYRRHDWLPEWYQANAK